MFPGFAELSAILKCVRSVRGTCSGLLVVLCLFRNCLSISRLVATYEFVASCIVLFHTTTFAMVFPLPFILSSLLPLAIAAATPPAQLYSPLISSKILTVAQTQQDPPAYPQYTDTTLGSWQYFTPDTWTSGFFPLTLYALNTRAQLCKTGDGDRWVQLGRQWSAAEVPLETQTSVDHDVGFLSMPFVEELYMYVVVIPGLELFDKYI
jgi:hypothetical protein